mgnify:FL=1
MFDTISKKAYAKINLFLKVSGARTDGYHDIETVMQQISLYDNVMVTSLPTHEGDRRITIECSEKSLPTDRTNIAYRCAAAFFDHFGINEYNIKIYIDKKIPIAAGLAGGSTDGAAVLELLNTVTKTNASLTELCNIGKKVGADIPFCLTGKTASAFGIGEIIKPIKIPSLPNYSILIIFPGDGVSTKEAYSLLDNHPSMSDYDISSVISELERGEIPHSVCNSFESVILPIHKNARTAKELLLSCGAKLAMMSGSGPSVFGLFDSPETLQNAYELTKKRGFLAFICSPIFD